MSGSRPDRSGATVGDSVVVSRLRSAADGSRVRAAVDELDDRLAAAGDRSRVLRALAGASDRLAAWSRDSWLLGPPAEPEVIVIDLRETYTVGPVLAVLDRTGGWAASRWRGSTPARALDRVAAAVTAAPVRALSVLALAASSVPVALPLAADRAPSGWLLLVVGLAVLGTLERRSASALRESRAGRALAALLVPPEPDEWSREERVHDDGRFDE